jgi:serine/threonine protein phosphatase PrpC
MIRNLMNWISRILGKWIMIKKQSILESRSPMTRVLQPAYTRRLRPEAEETPEATGIEDERREERTVMPSALAWHGLSDTGLVREHNEDNFLFHELGSGALFVVADGMGGHDAGEVASKIAVDTVVREVREGAARNKDAQRLIAHAVQQANAAVRREGASRGSNMGTTLSAAFIKGGTAYIANVGDSRTYWMENGSITQITEDHSLVAKLVSAGKMTKAEARNHPKSNLLYRTIGTDDNVKVDTFRVDLKKNGKLLLCTDGLWGMVPDEEIHRVFATEEDIKKACVRLVQAANAAGGQDNITAIVVKVK